MATYNTFLVVDCRSRRPLLATSSARKAVRALETGRRVEVWSENELVRTVYAKTKKELYEYTEAERQYIRAKQERATAARQRRKERINVS